MSTFNAVVADYQASHLTERRGSAIAALVAERFAAEDAARSAWLNERIRWERERMAEMVAGRRRP